MIFGGRRDTTPKVSVLVVDEDHSAASQSLIRGLEREGSLSVKKRPAPKQGVEQPDYTAATAEAAVKAGTAPVALIIPPWLRRKSNFIWRAESEPANDPVAERQQRHDRTTGDRRTAPESCHDLDAGDHGGAGIEVYGGVRRWVYSGTKKRIDAGLEKLRERESAENGAQQGATADSNRGMPIPVTTRDVVGENKNNKMVSFYAAAIGVMFLLFTASGAGGSLLDEAESGTLDRVLSTRVTMGTLLAGKLCFCVLLAFAQLVVMFTWAWLVFKVDFLAHIPGFVVMGLSTAFAVGAFGMVLASICRTRAQLGPLSTLVILLMSSIGGSMFPRYFMSEAMQKAGLLTINAWAIDGFTKVFWRDEPISHLWPQVLVLLAIGIALSAIARRLARRWEYS